MNTERSFGGWLRQRRRGLDLTQDELAQQVGCSAITLRKLEAESRRPSKQIAERLADVLKVPAKDRPAFLRFARGDPFAVPTDEKASEKLQPQPTPLHNLPLQLTRFIGREKEIAEVQNLLATTRLVTLTGPGGSGKTRLAVQAAAGLLDASAFHDGVWWIELARLGDPAFVISGVAAALNLKRIPGRPIADIQVDYIRPRRLLLLLDNCEHLIQACAELAEVLLRSCPHLRLLATSREELGIAGESTYPVGSLSLPDPKEFQTLAALAQSEAVRLFVDRSQLAVPTFKLTSANGPDVARVCRQLDGIPLAIELAAARIRVMRVDEIAAGLADRYQLLRGGSRTELPRHQTLQALVDWSYDLLSPAEQTLFRRLGVFVGGATLAAAQTICAYESVQSGMVLDLLSQLVSKSLVNVDREQADGTRYSMLETIRQYALAKLAGSDEAQIMRQRHAAYYLTFAQSGSAGIDEPTQEAGWVVRLAREEGNLRATLSWSQLATGNAELGLRLLLETYDFWIGHGYWSEARGWLETALARAEAEPSRDIAMTAGAMARLGELYELQGNYAAAQALLGEARTHFQDLGDRPWCLYATLHLGILAREQGDSATARLRLEENLALCRPEDEMYQAWSLVSLGEVMVMQEDAAKAASVLEQGQELFGRLQMREGLAWAANHLGHVAQLQGDYDLARRRHEASLPLFRESAAQNLGNLGEAFAFQGLGETALAQGGDAALAATHLRHALALFRDLGYRSGQAWCLAGLAGVAELDEDPERAARLWGAAEVQRQAIGCRPAPAAHATRERLITAAREQLGEAAFAAAWAEGEKLTMEQAVALALPDN